MNDLAPYLNSVVDTWKKEHLVFRAFETAPLISWIKSVEDNMKMVFLSERYEKIILEPLNKIREDYDFCHNIHDAELADKYIEHDWEVYFEKKGKHFFEIINTSSETYRADVFKFPIRIDEKWYIVGFIIEPIEKINETLNT